MATTSESPVAGDVSWDEIEANYFAQMCAHRERDDRALEEEYRAKSDELKQALLENYNAQSKLLRQLQALKDQYHDGQAALKTLESDFDAAREARAKEREREDEGRRAWFMRFRRDGLAYRQAEAPKQANSAAEGAVSGTGAAANGEKQEELPAADKDVPGAGSPDDDVHMNSVEVNGGHEVSEQSGASTSDAETNGINGTEQPVQSPEAEIPVNNESADQARNGETGDRPASISEEVNEEAPNEEIINEEMIVEEAAIEDVANEGIVHEQAAKEQARIEQASVEEGNTEKATIEQGSNGQASREQSSKQASDASRVEDHTEVAEAPELRDNKASGAGVTDGGMQAPAAPGSPASSTSSELSSRGTTPVLDTPLSLTKEPSPEPSPDDDASGTIEVLDESGTLIGRIRPTDTDNHLVKRIMALPIKRSVQIRSRRKFTAETLESIRHMHSPDARNFKWLSCYIQATGELQARPCQDCSHNYGPYEGCVMIDDGDFPRCGNCEWNKRGCHGASLQPRPRSRHDVSAQSPAKSPSRPTSRSSGSGFTAVNSTSASQKAKARAEGSAAKVGEEDDGIKEATGGTKKGPRKSLPTGRKAPASSTFSNESPGASEDKPTMLPEINKEVLCLRHDGVVFTDPPLMRGVPLEKITPEHPYWEPDWVPIERIVEPLMQRYQEKYEQLEAAGSTHRDKHLANRDAKRGRTILKFLREGDLHPYQLVAKEFINSRLIQYDTLFRLAQLLLEELPKFKLDVKPSEWLRHRLHELYLEKGDKFNVAAWLEKAYHDPKVEQIREKNGFVSIGRPPAHRMSKGPQNKSSSSSSNKDTVNGSSNTSKKANPRPLKRKEPHATPDSTPKKAGPASGNKTSSTASTATAAAPLHKRPRIVIKTGGAAAASSSSSSKDDETTPSDLDYDGYTSTDSISEDTLMAIDWRVQQVKTRAIASNTRVTQYWHWLGGAEGLFEHQVLRSVRPPKWSVFKEPYDFHLRLAQVDEVVYAAGSEKIVVVGRRDGEKNKVDKRRQQQGEVEEEEKEEEEEDLAARGDLMAQFKRERTKRRFLSFLKGQGVRLAEVSSAYMEVMWNSLNPETLPCGDSD
ncbi:hypothetical protein VTK56DRAFT_6703 [Thermocarpiscus australiensis]